MKNKLTHIQRMFFDRKAKSNKILFSFVALVLILSLLLTATYSWVETVSTISIQGKGKVDSAIYTNANMDISSSESIDLSKYFKEAGNVHLAPALSHDGVNFQFRKLNRTQDGQPSYRQGNINDKNVNYISFSFKVKAMKKDTEFYFENAPKIKIGDSQINDNSVKFAITTGDSTSIYSNSNASTVRAFSDYTYKEDYTGKFLFSLEKETTDIVTISMWLDESANNYAGKSVVVTDFKIVAKGKKGIQISADYADECDDTMGTLSVEKTEEGDTLSKAILKVEPKEEYHFVGWFKNKDGSGSAVSSKTEYEVKATADTTYYAKFEKKVKISVSFVKNCEGYGSVYVTDDTTKTYVYVEKNKTVELKYSANDGYGFAGWYQSDDGSGDKLSGNTVTATSDKTYFAKFEPSVTISVGFANNCSNTMGTLTVDGKTGSATVAKDTQVTLKATNKDGYEFVGWFEAPNASGSAVSDDLEYTVSATATKSYYAKFKKVVYLNLTNVDWEKDGAIIAYHTWGGGDSKWVFMSDNDGDNIFTADYPEGHTGILFARLRTGSTVSNANIWNQTGDLDLNGTKNCCTITDMNGGCSWGVYSSS